MGADEADLVVRLLEGVLAGGPVAVILSVMCYLLWKRNGELHTQYRELYAENRTQWSSMVRLAARMQCTVETLVGVKPDIEDASDTGD